MTNGLKLNLLLMITLALVVGLSLSSCDSNGDKGDKEKAEVLTPVEIAKVTRHSISAYLNGAATLEAEEEAEVVAKTSEIVTEILVEEGMPVRKGQILARLDSKMLSIEVDQARADINKAENDFNRNKELFEKNLISKEEFQSVGFQFEAQKAAFEKSKLNLQYTDIRAPIAGVVATRNIKTGNMVKLNDPLFKIVDFDPLIAVLFVPEVDIHKMRVGQKAQLVLDATNSSTSEGSVLRISPIVDPQSGTVRVTVAVRDENRALKPGMFARVQIVYDTHENTLLVPKQAVISEDGLDMVYVIEDSLALRRQVITGYSDENHFEILDGLSIDDRVVVVGQNTLKDSVKIEIIQSIGSDSVAANDD